MNVKLKARVLLPDHFFSPPPPRLQSRPPSVLSKEEMGKKEEEEKKSTVPGPHLLALGQQPDHYHQIPIYSQEATQICPNAYVLYMDKIGP